MPLQNALGARDPGWEPHLVRVHNLVERIYGESSPTPIGELEDVLVQAGLCRGDEGVVLGAQAELKVPKMGGSQVNLDVNNLPSFVFCGNDAPAIQSSSLMGPGLGLVEGVSTNSTLAFVQAKLGCGTPAEALVVVVVGLGIEGLVLGKAPQGPATSRLPETTVSMYTLF